MENQVPDEVKTIRSGRLLSMADKDSKEYRESYIGQETEVLFEEERVIDGRAYQTGHTVQYVKIALQTEENLSNTMRRGKIKDFLTEDILLMEI